MVIVAHQYGLVLTGGQRALCCADGGEDTRDVIRYHPSTNAVLILWTRPRPGSNIERKGWWPLRSAPPSARRLWLLASDADHSVAPSLRTTQNASNLEPI
jgi:hypothetical protein